VCAVFGAWWRDVVGRHQDRAALSGVFNFAHVHMRLTTYELRNRDACSAKDAGKIIEDRSSLCTL